ncbi:MAG: hypothetical protein ABI359_13105 [Ginsengibacter sp.]
MKTISTCIALAFALMIISCKKNDNTNLSLLQHTWQVVSVNGEAYRYLGTAQDYYNFAPDNFLYQYINKNFDTSNYSLLTNGRTLLLYHVVHGIKSSTPFTFNINSLTNKQLILSNHSGVVFALDSLKR